MNQNMKKIIILNARGYFGGTLILNLLCKLLRDNGIDAKILYIHEFYSENENLLKYWYLWLKYTIKYRIKQILFKLLKKTKYAKHKRFSIFSYIPIKGIKEKYLPFYNRKDTIVIYPEMAFGNCLFAKNVVRYLLFHYKYKNIRSAYSNNDLFISYRDIFNDKGLNPDGHTLTLNYIDTNMYKQINYGERFGNCYLIRKGRSRNDLPSHFDGPIIDFGTPESDIVKIFNNSKYCYSYDTQTFYMNIAAICGCIPIVVLEPGKTRKDYLGSDEINIPGIAYGDSKAEIEYAINTRNDLLKNLDYTRTNNDNILNFINLLKNKFI